MDVLDTDLYQRWKDIKKEKIIKNSDGEEKKEIVAGQNMFTISFFHFDQWDKLIPRQWACVLRDIPQFADKCKTWSDFRCDDWIRLLIKQPQFADKCDRWDDFHWIDWKKLLEDQPQFADKFDNWDELDGKAWGELLFKQPQFADKCDKWDEVSWLMLLEKQPQLKKYQLN